MKRLGVGDTGSDSDSDSSSDDQDESGEKHNARLNGKDNGANNSAKKQKQMVPKARETAGGAGAAGSHGRRRRGAAALAREKQVRREVAEQNKFGGENQIFVSGRRVANRATQALLPPRELRRLARRGGLAFLPHVAYNLSASNRFASPSFEAHWLRRLSRCETVPQLAVQLRYFQAFLRPALEQHKAAHFPVSQAALLHSRKKHYVMGLHGPMSVEQEQQEQEQEQVEQLDYLTRQHQQQQRRLQSQQQRRLEKAASAMWACGAAGDESITSRGRTRQLHLLAQNMTQRAVMAVSMRLDGCAMLQPERHLGQRAAAFSDSGCIGDLLDAQWKARLETLAETVVGDANNPNSCVDGSGATASPRKADIDVASLTFPAESATATATATATTTTVILGGTLDFSDVNANADVSAQAEAEEKAIPAGQQASAPTPAPTLAITTRRVLPMPLALAKRGCASS